MELARLAETIRDGLLHPGAEHYSWDPSETAWKLLQGFNGAKLPEPDRNISLREYLRRRWQTADRDERHKLAKWIISDWGGINGNRDETIRAHVELVEAGNIAGPFNGIASYSKVFAISAPERYAIYDARVATSLNAIQLLKGRHILAFPIPPGRNTEIDPPKGRVGFRKLYSRQILAKNGFAKAPLQSTYRVYLDLLQQIKGLTDESILRLEMKLFARAEEFSKAVRAAM